MFNKIVIALIIIGLLVIGYARFSGSLAQASHDCSSDSAVLAANPELTAACRYHNSVTADELELSQATEAGEGRSDDLTDSAFLAANPELSAARGYASSIEEQGSQPVIIDPEALRQFSAQQSVIWVIVPDASDPSPVMQPADNGITLPQSDFLAANPELSIVRRYADAIEQGNS